MKRYRRWLLLVMLMLTGCGGIEPEERSYPLVLGIDWKDNQLQMIYGLANLQTSTGQQKEEETSSESRVLSFYGTSIAEILKQYNQTQDRYLDMGHVQAVILGKSLLKQTEQYGKVLNYFEKNPVLGDSAAVFCSASPESILQFHDTDMKSLGSYLTGIYENKFDDQRAYMVILQDLYRKWNEEQKKVELPGVEMEADFPKVTA